MSRLFKARYIPNTDFLICQIGANPSYVWRSIFSDKIDVQHGARWRIGTGANIPLFGAPWLKDGRSFTTNCPMYETLSHVKVQNIIEPTTKVWSTTLISSPFGHNTIQIILNTTLHPLVSENKLVRKAEKNGNYFVRSAYRICVTDIADNFHLHVPGRWNLIWKLKVPPKIKNFVWRECRGCFLMTSRHYVILYVF